MKINQNDIDGILKVKPIHIKNIYSPWDDYICPFCSKSWQGINEIDITKIEHKTDCLYLKCVLLEK